MAQAITFGAGNEHTEVELEEFQRGGAVNSVGEAQGPLELSQGGAQGSSAATLTGEPQDEVLPPSGVAFISTLVSIAKDAFYHTNIGTTYSSSIHSLLSDLTATPDPLSTPADLPNFQPSDDIHEAAHLAKLCHKVDNKAAKLQVKYFFSTIMLAAAGNR